MAATVDYYEQLIEAFPSTESLTVVIASGTSREEVAAALEVDLSDPVAIDPVDDIDSTSWALLDVSGGVLAVEKSGYGDPASKTLQALSVGGRAAAVIRSNIDGNLRFGCARDGELLFDADEYETVEDPSVMPAELRPLFDLVWDDLEAEPRFDAPGGFIVGLAMAESITAIEITVDQVATVFRTGFFKAPIRY